MLNDCNYNKTKLMHELSRLAHFLKKHAIEDATNNGHPLCEAMYKEMYDDIEKHIDKLREAVGGLSKEEKFN